MKYEIENDPPRSGKILLRAARRARLGALLLTLVCAGLLTGNHALAGEQPESRSNVRPAAIKLEPDAVAWRERAPGLDVLELNISRGLDENGPLLQITAAKESSKSDLVIVRSDPKRCEYTLHMASEDGLHLSLLERLKQHDLLAAINAGMYLQDNRKNTGYMRRGNHTNNPRIVANFGSFFVAGARKGGIPQADLLEKSELGANPVAKLAEYDLVIQNYRLISLRRGILWPESNSAYSISALGKDEKGNILFIACEFPLSAPDFSRLLLSLPIGNSLAMYLEGGSQAGLALRAEKDGKPEFRVWRGRHGGLAGLNRPSEVPLPNVLGVRLKSQAQSN